jgi:4-amino-4-deoxy-L-arabinose transferase-like glycosyltransferase
VKLSPHASILDRWSAVLSSVIDGLCDPRRQRRTLLALVCGYGATWFLYGVVAKSSQDLNADLAEMIVWAHEPALGYPKHPPFLAYVIRAWFTIFPQADWAFMLLAAVTLSAGLYLAFEVCGLWLDGEKRAAVPFLLGVIPFYNFLGLKFDQNSALIPLWALAILGLLRSLETRRTSWAVVTALAASAAILTKYWTGFLLAAMLLTCLCDRRRDVYFRSKAPWLTALIFIAAVLPHAIWLVREKFPPLHWIDARRTADSGFDFYRSLSEYSFGTIGYVAPAVVLVALLIHPSGKAVRDSWFVTEPARRPATLLFWIPLLLPIVVAAARQINLLSVWNEPSFSLLPVMMLASPLVIVSRLAATRIAFCAAAYTVIALAASPIVAWVLLERGVENSAAYSKLVAAAIERQWRETSTAPLGLVGGQFALSNSAAFYLADKPSSYADFSGYLSPWVTAQRIDRDGIAIVCAAEDDGCLGKLNEFTVGNAAARRSEVTLVRHWLSFSGAPKRFVIATVPPRA